MINSEDAQGYNADHTKHPPNEMILKALALYKETDKHASEYQISHDAEVDQHLCQLVEAIRQLNESAFATFYDLLVGKVYGLVWRICGEKTLADEVTEDVFWQVWCQAARFDPTRGKVMAWVLMMARSRALDALRQRKVHADQLSFDGLADGIDALYDDQSWGVPASPQDLLLETQTHRLVHHALASLDPQVRQLIALAFFKGFTHEEIAYYNHMPLGSVKSLIRRGLKSLSDILAKHAVEHS